MSDTTSSPENTPSQRQSPHFQTTHNVGTAGKASSMRQQNAQKLLFQFSKTFVDVMESTIFSHSHDQDGGDEYDEYVDNFDPFSSHSTLDHHSQPISDEAFAFEKYFPSEKKEHFRTLFISVAFDIFQSYEYQLVMLVREKRKICEIAEDIVHRILDNFKESQRGCNPDFIKPDITRRFLIEMALQHTEPEGITYNSEWSAVEILENPGILIKCEDQSSSIPGLFYQSDWQKNFIGVKKKIGSKYGFRLKFNFETELSILRNFEKVPLSSVYPLYLQYKYCLDEELVGDCRKELEKELHIQDKMKKYGIYGEAEKDMMMKDKVKEFQLKLQIQKQDEERNSDKVMKQVTLRGKEKLQNKLERLQEQGILQPDNLEKARIGLLKANYNVKFEVKDSFPDFHPSSSLYSTNTTGTTTTPNMTTVGGTQSVVNSSSTVDMKVWKASAPIPASLPTRSISVSLPKN